MELPYQECCKTEKHLHTTCPACGVEYCSENCRVQAFEQYHKVLCPQTFERNNVHPLEELEETWKCVFFLTTRRLFQYFWFYRQMHYPPETSSIFLIVRLLARILQAPDTENAIQTTLSFCHRSVNEEAELAHKFLGDQFEIQVDLLRQMVGRALPDPKVAQFLTSEGFQSLIALIGK